MGSGLRFLTTQTRQGASRRRPFIPGNIPLIPGRRRCHTRTNTRHCHGVLTGTPLRAQYVYTVHTEVPPLLQPSPWPFAAGTATPRAHRMPSFSLLGRAWSLSHKMQMREPFIFREADGPTPPLVRRREHTRSNSGDIDYSCCDLLVCLDDEGVYFKLFSERR